MTLPFRAPVGQAEAIVASFVPTLDASVVRLIPQNSSQTISIPYSEIAALAFSGRDTAAGKRWEAWVRKYWEKKAAGEKGVALEPEKLE